MAHLLLRPLLRRAHRHRHLSPLPTIIPPPPFHHHLLLPFTATFCTYPTKINKPKPQKPSKNTKPISRITFNKLPTSLLPTVILVGRPNVGKSALFNRLIGRREALVYNTPDGHVTRDIREGLAKLGDLRFHVLDSAGLETAATTGSILSRTTEMTGNVISRSQFAIFLIDVRDGLQSLDQEVGKWMRKHASGIHVVVAMNKSESLYDGGLLSAALGDGHRLGFGDPIAISAETGLGMAELYETLRPLLEEYVLARLPNDFENQEDNQVPEGNQIQEDNQVQEDICSETEECGDLKLPLQLAIVGRPNVGKSTLLNALLQEERVLVGPEAGLTRDSIRAEFQFEERTIYLVDTAGWLPRTGKDKGPESLSVVQSRKSLMRAHVIALVLDAEEIANNKVSMKHAEVLIARKAVEEGRGLIVIVNKMDILRRRENLGLFDMVLQAVPKEIQTVIPQITGIPVVFVSALEGKGRLAIMHQVVDTYQKWCTRLSTARLNRWLGKVMSRHSWKDQATQSKIKYFTQVKGRPPTFIAFLSGKATLSDTDIRFLAKSLTDDFDLGGIPIRIMQRTAISKVPNKKNNSPFAKTKEKMRSDKRANT